MMTPFSSYHHYTLLMGHDVMRAQDDHEHVHTVENVDQLAEGGQVEYVHEDISRE